MFSPLAIAWNTLALAGQAGLLLLLITFLRVPSLSQRENPFLINMLLTMYLAAIPPILLLITGQQEKITVKAICIAQSALLDGVPAMWGTAVTVLVFQVWCEMRSIIKLNGQYMHVRSPTLRGLLLAAPYVIYILWTLTSLLGSLVPPVDVKLKPFVFCTDQGPNHHTPVRIYVGPFAAILGVISIILEVMTAKLLFTRTRSSSASYASLWMKYRYTSTARIFLRMVAFNLLQLGPLVLTIATKINVSKDRIPAIDGALEILEVSYPIGVFVLFATQRNVLEAWRILPPSTEKSIDKC